MLGYNQTVAGLNGTYANAYIEDEQGQSSIANATLTINTVNSSDNFNYNGFLRDGGSGHLSLVKTGPGTQTLSGNSFAGGFGGSLSVTGGTLVIDGTNATNSNYGAVSVISISANATLQLNSNNGSALRWNSGSNTEQITGAGTFLRTGTAYVYFGNYPIYFNQSAGGLADFEGGTSAYLGSVSTNLGGLTINGSSTASTTVTSFESYSSTVQNSYFDALNGNSYGIYSNQAVDTLHIGTNNGNGTFAGRIQNGSGQSLIKQGTGFQVLGGSNSYTGTTVVSGGTLSITGSLASGSAVTVAAGAPVTAAPRSGHRHGRRYRGARQRRHPEAGRHHRRRFQQFTFDRNRHADHRRGNVEQRSRLSMENFQQRRRDFQLRHRAKRHARNRLRSAEYWNRDE